MKSIKEKRRFLVRCFIIYNCSSQTWVAEIEAVVEPYRRRLSDPGTAASFYRCLSTVMTEQLRSLFIDSLDDLTALLAPRPNVVKKSDSFLLIHDCGSLALSVCSFMLPMVLTSHCALSVIFKPPMPFKGFVLRAVLEDSSIRFEPDFPSFESMLTGLADVLVRAVSEVPRFVFYFS